MTILELKKAVAEYLNGKELGVPFIVAPLVDAAPVGCYVAVNCLSVRQSGSVMKPAPNIDKDHAYIQQVANMALYEVEGDGDMVRKVRNLLQLPDFIGFLESRGATVWNVGDIVPVDTYDGDFLIRQWVMTFELNFEDVERHETQTILSVEPIEFEQQEG